MSNNNNNDEMPRSYRLSEFRERRTVEDTSNLLLTVLDLQDVNESTFALYYSPPMEYEYSEIPERFLDIVNTYNMSWFEDEFGEGMNPQIIIRKVDTDVYRLVVEAYPDIMVETAVIMLNTEGVLEFMNFMGKEEIEVYDAGMDNLSEYESFSF